MSGGEGMLPKKCAKLGFAHVRALCFVVLTAALWAPPTAALSLSRFLDLPLSYVEARQCSFNFIGDGDIPTELPTRLTSGWSQEGVGLPEVRLFLQEENIQLRRVPLAVLDVDHYDVSKLHESLQGPEPLSPTLQDRTFNGVRQGTHGTRVALVIGGRQFGMAPNAYFTSLFVEHRRNIYAWGSPEEPFEILSRSLGVVSWTPQGLEALKKINKGQNFFLVNSAGNSFAESYWEMGVQPEKSLGEVQAFIVSAVTPSGRTHLNSGGGPGVIVGAPSYGPGLMNPDGYNQNLDGGTEFNGTSAAAPMVTGALVGVMGLIKGISFNEAQQLIQNTSFRTRSFQDDHSYGGYGVLNYYKMMRVAHRLQQGGWPQGRSAVSKTGEGSLYDFSGESEQILKDVKDYLRAHLEGSCEDKTWVLKELRKGFFLNPQHEGIRQALYALYANEGYHDQGLYFSPSGYEFYGSGVYSTQDNGRGLLNALAEGNYELALRVLRRGGLPAGFVTESLAGKLGELVATRPGARRDEFIRKSLTLPFQSSSARGIYEMGLYIGAQNEIMAQREGFLGDFVKSGVLPPSALNIYFFHAARYNLSTELMQLFLEHGADPNYQASEGHNATAVHYAAFFGNIESLRLFLQAGARLDLKDTRGQTALDYAVMGQQPHAVEMLLNAGVPLEQSTLDLAVRYRDPVILQRVQSKARQSALGSVKAVRLAP